jgi:uncharacterized lipoprotein YmbA
MKNFLCAGLGIVLMTLVGCANSPATRFYMLNSTPDIMEMAGKTDDRCAVIGIGPVEMPSYLTRLRIATASSDNEINYAEFDHWAQPLSDNISQVMAENLARLVCTRVVYRFPWMVPEQPDYRVRMEVTTMTGSLLNLKAVMEVWWTISDKDKKVIVSRKSRYVEPVPGEDYKALAQAYSKILATFSRDVAKAIPSL